MKRKVLIVLAVLALIGLYARGTFDHLLYNVGLNAHECARNGFGATFCGHELDEYRAKIERVKQEGEAAQAKIKEESARRENEAQAEAQRIKEASEASAAVEHAKEQQALKGKMEGEKAIFEREPEGSVASDLAKDEYEYARAQLQQLEVRGGG
jgi:hypothetical protein